MGWTLSERLFILFEDGRVCVYSIRGTKVGEVKLFDQAFTDLVCCGERLRRLYQDGKTVGDCTTD